MSQVNITLSIPHGFAWQSAKFWQDANARAAILARFWAFVNRAKGEGSCWEWTGSTNGRGYGLFAIRGRLRAMAHKLAYALAKGPIPRGQEVCHRCDNPRCVNPAHLFLGSHRENLRDAIRKGRKNCWGHQKLDAARVGVLRHRYATGRYTQKELAREFGISRNNVSQIVNRKTWAHLDTVPDLSRVG